LPFPRINPPVQAKAVVAPIEARVFAALCCALGLGACDKPPSAREQVATASAARSASRPPVPPPAASRDLEPAPSAEAICERFATTPVPEADLPDASELGGLRGCDAEAWYYGIGVTVDYERARKCAYARVDQVGDSVIGGPEILMMSYANGRGVPVRFELALRFACQVGGAPAELQLRTQRLWDARASGKLEGVLDVCDDITSGMMSGYCAAHAERIDAIARQARLDAAGKSLPSAELEALRSAAERFFAKRSRLELDLTGSTRAALQIEERASLEDAFVSALEQLPSAAFPPDADDATKLNRELALRLGRLNGCKSTASMERLVPGSPSRAGMRETQSAWVAYRRAFVDLAMKTRPDSKRDAWLAWLTKERLSQLGDCSDK